MHLTFKHERLAELWRAAKPQWEKEVRPSYVQTLGEPDAPPAVPAGFWLVGDEGVYLMHNGRAHDTGEKRQPVVYAEECNPETMLFDDWWEIKNTTFGEDDGVEDIERNIVEDAVRTKSNLRICFEPGQPSDATGARSKNRDDSD